MKILNLAVAAAAGLMLASTTATATTIDLTSGGDGSAVAAVGGEFLATWADQQLIGSAVNSPFLRLQNGGNEQGYNTSLGTPLDDKSGGFTRALPLSEIPIVTIGGINYRQFLLDINEGRGSDDELLSLNQIQLFQSSSDQLHNSLTAASLSSQAVIGFASPATEIFRMNNEQGDLEIRLNYLLNQGTGIGDMFLYIRDANFDTSISNVILYSQFGVPSGFASSTAGFEEWSVIQPGAGAAAETPVPEPATLLLFGTGIALVARRARRRNKK